jgi:hypothetical protein
VGNKNNCAKNNLEKLDEENENIDKKIENETGERNNGRIMNYVIVKMENESENEERKECENITDECENKEESMAKVKTIIIANLLLIWESTAKMNKMESMTV